MADRVSTCSAVDRRLARLQQRAEVRAATIHTWQWYHFRVTPTCPPSQALTVRAGLILPAYRYGLVQDQTYIPDQTCDFADTDSTGLEASFSNAAYYLGILLCYRGPWLLDMTEDQPFTMIGDGIEYETAAGAEASLEFYLEGGSDWMYELFPLWATVLRNDGRIGTPGAVLAVDAINRGRSYLWRDIRPRVMMAK